MKIILIMGVISFLLRVTPFFIKRDVVQSKSIISTLDYAVCFILGLIIFNTATNRMTFEDFFIDSDLHYGFIFSVTTIFIAFFITKKTGSILYSLFISLFFYAATMMVF